MKHTQCEFFDIQKEDFDDYIRLSEEFYQTDSVSHKIPTKHFMDAFNLLMENSPYLRCIMIKCDGKNVGYATLALTYSIEAGGIAVWAEELYIEPSHRKKGFGQALLNYLDSEYKDKVARIRLEVIPEKEHLMKLYKKSGYKMIPYAQMYKDFE